MEKSHIFRLGALIPATNLVVEPEIYSFVNDEYHIKNRVAIHFSRIDFTISYSQNKKKFLSELCDNSATAALRLRTIQMDVLGFFCTSATQISSISKLKEVFHQFHKQIPIPIVTSIDAVILACKRIDAKDILLITPYDEELTNFMTDLFMKSDINVTKQKSLNLNNSSELVKVGFTSLKDIIRSEFNEKVDAIVISCTNFPTFHIISTLERELKVPIISSNQATLWQMLKQCRERFSLSDKYGFIFSLF